MKCYSSAKMLKIADKINPNFQSAKFIQNNNRNFTKPLTSYYTFYNQKNLELF